MDNKALNLATTGIRILIAVLGVIFIIMTISGSSTDENGRSLLDGTGETGLDFALTLTYIAVGLCAVAWALFGLADLVLNFKDRKKVFIGFIVFIVLLFIGYALSGDHVFHSWAEKGVTADTSKWVGAGLMSFYVMLTGAVLAIIWSEVSRFIR